jgi:hypothetical protein
MMMGDKTQVIAMLRDEFNRWEAILSAMSEAQITDPKLPEGWSVKDVIAHLWAWQQRSIARMVAALRDREPEFPRWASNLDPEMEGQPHQLNAWLYETNKNKSWSQVYGDWKAGFLHLLELAQAFSEKDLLDPEKYAWLDGYTLAYILRASYEHHGEHRGWLLPLLLEDGTLKDVE